MKLLIRLWLGLSLVALVGLVAGWVYVGGNTHQLAPAAPGEILSQKIK